MAIVFICMVPPVIRIVRCGIYVKTAIFSLGGAGRGAGHFFDHIGWRAIISSIDTSNSRLLEPLRSVQCVVVVTFVEVNTYNGHNCSNLLLTQDRTPDAVQRSHF